MKLIPVAKRKGSFAEVEIAWPRAVALGESKRCLRCDYRETLSKCHGIPWPPSRRPRPLPLNREE